MGGGGATDADGPALAAGRASAVRTGAASTLAAVGTRLESRRAGRASSRLPASSPGFSGCWPRRPASGEAGPSLASGSRLGDGSGEAGRTGEPPASELSLGLRLTTCFGFTAEAEVKPP